ncbi:hypothetical protein PsorP6_012347 [Peronosclerospora sorghi]|uniref:Uncharacterized protein n=1 Tax=Peronosclerospora sorghi TaxID=230839 RepID=A0ACC0WGN4_9STRA|nr:hypothetical protein PsorP6_012347 [Peronosclerospora sorghi]
MVLTGISTLIQSQWQLLCGAFDPEGHERRVQLRQKKKQEKKQRKAARRAAREARRAQRSQRHTPLYRSEPRHGEESARASSNSNRTPEVGSLPRPNKALSDVAYKNGNTCFSEIEPRHVEEEGGNKKPSTAVVPALTVAEMPSIMPQQRVELTLKDDAQMEQKARQFYDSLGGYTTCDNEDGEPQEQVLDKSLGQERMANAASTSEFLTNTPLSDLKPKAKSLSSSSEWVETELEDEEVGLRDSAVFDGYSTFDEEESQRLFIVDHELDGLCSLPTDVAGIDLHVSRDSTMHDAVEMKEHMMRDFSTAVVKLTESLDADGVLSDEPAEIELEEELEIIVEGEVEMMRKSKLIEDKSDKKVMIEAFEEPLHEREGNRFDQPAGFLVSPCHSPVPSCASTRNTYSPGSLDDYACSIYENLRAREHRYHVTEDIFAEQHTIRPKMRAVLVDWLIEVHQRFELETQTLHLTVNYVDRYLAQSSVTSQRFQLVGVAALLIASKFEEIYPCDMDDLLYICERSYTKEDLINCERDLLNVFKFNLAVPSISSFLGYYLHHFEEEGGTVEHLANYFAEYSLLHFSFGATYEPSIVACACLLTAYCYFENQSPSLVWSYRLRELTGYPVEAIVPCARDLSSLLIQPTELTAVTAKYSVKALGEVAHLPLDDLKVLLR